LSFAVPIDSTSLEVANLDSQGGDDLLDGTRLKLRAVHVA